MQNVHRFGNEFWVEGDWHNAAKVEMHESLRDGSITFQVSYGSHGSGTAEEQKPYGLAIVAACDYADICAELYKGKTRQEIQAEWNAPLDTFYRGLYKEWQARR